MYQTSFFPVEELSAATLVSDFGFTGGAPLLRVPARRNVAGQPVGHVGQGGGYEDTTTVLFDLKNDYEQLHPFRDADIETRLLKQMTRLMTENEAPPEAFLRLGLSPGAA